MARSGRAAAQRRLVLDSGAVIALSRRDERARAALSAAVEAGVDVMVPAVVLAETLRGGPSDAAVHRVLNAVGEVIVVDAEVSRLAGTLLGAARSSSTVDALVVACAITAGGGVILTSDPADVSALAEQRTELRVQRV